ncbi:NAD kinase [Sulfuriferula plumbiphila]|uniref:NAD kinase n=1 Tax=Sulfuriferula plumbiphila TaxID=171865 RepID=A0A512L7R1_9PROT|nr:NAD kinase [Sulfuriferula plumbiphila]BBP03958.1 NAD kinase [Sulfuriferula plumbiphila]GEP30525.1 NAD kinase [Sulfuriferula plumbiphila]
MSEIFQTIALVGKYDSPEIGEALLRLADFLRGRGHDVLIARNTAEHIGSAIYPIAELAEIGSRADLAVVLGGDGTMLSIARMLMKDDIPLMGVNQGHLGFLTDVPVEAMFESMAAILDGEYVAEQRLLLNAGIVRDGEEIFAACAFNDVVVSKASSGRLIEFEVFIDGDFVYRQRSDGLIIATPTGSTAYALSAGGPILHPTLEAFVLVPICAHTLSARPIAVNSRSAVELRLIVAGDARVYFDGQRHFDVQVGDRIMVSRAPKTLRLLHPKNYSYYFTLRHKLHWGTQL